MFWENRHCFPELQLAWFNFPTLGIFLNLISTHRYISPVFHSAPAWHSSVVFSFRTSSSILVHMPTQPRPWEQESHPHLSCTQLLDLDPGKPTPLKRNSWESRQYIHFSCYDLCLTFEVTAGWCLCFQIHSTDLNKNMCLISIRLTPS